MLMRISVCLIIRVKIKTERKIEHNRGICVNGG